MECRYVEWTKRRRSVVASTWRRVRRGCGMCRDRAPVGGPGLALTAVGSWADGVRGQRLRPSETEAGSRRGNEMRRRKKQTFGQRDALPWLRATCAFLPSHNALPERPEDDRSAPSTKSPDPVPSPSAPSVSLARLWWNVENVRDDSRRGRKRRLVNGSRNSDEKHETSWDRYINTRMQWCKPFFFFF